MKFLLDNWYWIAAALLSGGMLAWPAITRRGGAGRVSAMEAVTLINREKAVLIDVGEPQEFAAGHAIGAKNIPFGSLQGSTALPKNKALPIVVLCPSGARATRAVGILKTLGHENSHAVSGGLAAWREANLPIEKTAA